MNSSGNNHIVATDSPGILLTQKIEGGKFFVVLRSVNHHGLLLTIALTIVYLGLAKRFFPLMILLLSELPALTILFQGSDDLCSLVGMKRFQMIVSTIFVLKSIFSYNGGLLKFEAHYDFVW